MLARRGSPFQVSLMTVVLAQREDEDVKVALEGRFRPAGGDFQGIWVYRPDVANCGWFSSYTTLVFHRFVSMSPSGYPSAKLRPRRARFRFT